MDYKTWSIQYSIADRQRRRSDEPDDDHRSRTYAIFPSLRPNSMILTFWVFENPQFHNPHPRFPIFRIPDANCERHEQEACDRCDPLDVDAVDSTCFEFHLQGNIDFCINSRECSFLNTTLMTRHYRTISKYVFPSQARFFKHGAAPGIYYWAPLAAGTCNWPTFSLIKHRIQCLAHSIDFSEFW